MAQMNPMQLLMMIKNGKNPQQLMMSYLQQNMGNTPIGQNLLGLMRENKTADIETFARNFCASRGVDFDKEFSSFRQSLGI